MTLQEIFDRVSKHLLAQNAKSERKGYKGGMLCAYRGNNGKSCAVGCLIADKDYNEDLEGLSVENHKVQDALGEVLATDTRALDLLSQLQLMHDRYSTGLWPIRLGYIAEEFGLKGVRQ